MKDAIIMSDRMRKYRVPKELPANLGHWQRMTSARWFEDAEEVAAIYRLIDDDGYVTPITYQFDRRHKQYFKTGYGFIDDKNVFEKWSDVVAYWPTYLKEHTNEQSD